MAPAVNWQYDDSLTFLVGPYPGPAPAEAHPQYVQGKRAIPHHGEHHMAQYKGHKLRILRVVKKLYPDEAHSDLVQSWQGECDGVEIPGMVAEQSNPIAEALIAHVDAL